MERFINTLFEDKGKSNNLLEEIKKLGSEDKKFIDEKAIELEQIDNEIANDVQMNVNPNLNIGLKKLQMNILTLFLMSKIQNPDCSEEIRKIIMKFNKKIETVNQILEKNLNRVSSSTNNQSTNNQSTNNQSPNNQSTNNQSTNNQSPNNQSTNNQSTNNQSPNNSSNLVRNQQSELSRVSKINSKNELVNYLKEFNNINAVNDNSSKENDPLTNSLKEPLLGGIDNPKYKDIVEKLMNDEFNGRYSYANLFGLPLAINENYEESSQPASRQPAPKQASPRQPAPTQPASPKQPAPKQSSPKQPAPTQQQVNQESSQQIEDIDDYVDKFVKKNNLANIDPTNEDVLPNDIKTKFISNLSIKNNKSIMELINSKPFTMALLTEIRGI